MSRSAAPSIDVTMPMRRGRAGQRPLARLLEQALGGELLLELLERELQRAQPMRLHVLADELILALRVVDADAAAHDDVQSVFGLELQIAQRRPEHDALDLRAAVLEREVEMAGRPHLRVRQLALDPDFRKRGFEHLAERGRELADREDLAHRRCEARRVGSAAGFAGSGSSNGRSKSVLTGSSPSMRASSVGS